MHICDSEVGKITTKTKSKTKIKDIFESTLSTNFYSKITWEPEEKIYLPGLVPDPLYPLTTPEVLSCLTFHGWRNQDSRKLRKIPQDQRSRRWHNNQAPVFFVFEGHSFSDSLKSWNSQLRSYERQAYSLTVGEDERRARCCNYCSYFISPSLERKSLGLHFYCSLK